MNNRTSNPASPASSMQRPVALIFFCPTKIRARQTKNTMIMNTFLTTLLILFSS